MANGQKTSKRYKVPHYPNEAQIRPNLLPEFLVRFLAQGPTIATTFLLRFFSPLEKCYTNWRCSDELS